MASVTYKTYSRILHLSTWPFITWRWHTDPDSAPIFPPTPYIALTTLLVTDSRVPALSIMSFCTFFPSPSNSLLHIVFLGKILTTSFTYPLGSRPKFFTNTSTSFLQCLNSTSNQTHIYGFTRLSFKHPPVCKSQSLLMALQVPLTIRSLTLKILIYTFAFAHSF